jgi:hypothetical protein
VLLCEELEDLPLQESRFVQSDDNPAAAGLELAPRRNTATDPVVGVLSVQFRVTQSRLETRLSVRFDVKG